MLLPIESGTPERLFQKLFHRMSLARGDDIILRLILLHHQPHRLDIFLGVSPVAFCVQVSEIDGILQPSLDARKTPGDLACDECLAPARGFVVEEYSVASEHPVTLAVIDRAPIGVDLRTAVRTSRVKRGRFLLRYFLRHPEHLAARCLIEFGFDPCLPDRLENSYRPETGNIARVLRDVKTHAHMTLCGEVVNLIRFEPVEEFDQIGGIADIPVVKEKTHTVDMRVGIEVVDSARIECARTENDPMDFVPLLQEEFRQVRTVLACNSRNECFFHNPCSFVNSI